MFDTIMSANTAVEKMQVEEMIIAFSILLIHSSQKFIINGKEIRVRRARSFYIRTVRVFPVLHPVLNDLK